MAFFFAMRRASLLETNHRLRRKAVSLPLFETFLRNRLSSCCWDSLFLSSTFVNWLFSFRYM